MEDEYDYPLSAGDEQILERLDELLEKMDVLTELMTTILSVTVDVKHWIMLLFVVVSIGLGLTVGYLVGKR